MTPLLLFAALAAAQPTATITKPKPVTVTGGQCRVKDDGTLGVNVGPNAAMPTLALTIGPGAFMAKEMKANLAKFTGPGTYQNEIIAVYLGKTALEDAYMGLGTVTINADTKSGRFALNDGKAAGTFDCGAPPAK
ncbi:MAG TPA: hypothetical protein VFA27_15015 [Vicinamibacterales bacterium]|nr:hypothetical protein [Vicinamibacterales bacterium]